MSKRKMMKAGVNVGNFMWDVLQNNLNVANIS